MDLVDLFNKKRSKTVNISIFTLPREIIYRIISFLCYPELINFALTSKKSYFICDSDFIWKQLFKKYQFNIHSRLCRDIYEKSKSWRQTFISRYTYFSTQWMLILKGKLPHASWWSFSNNSRISFGLFGSTFKALDLDTTTKHSIEVHQVVSSKTVQVDVIPHYPYRIEFHNYVESNGILYTYHDKECDIVVIYSVLRGALILFQWNEENSKLVAEYEFKFGYSKDIFVDVCPKKKYVACNYENCVHIFSYAPQKNRNNFKAEHLYSVRVEKSKLNSLFISPHNLGFTTSEGSFVLYKLFEDSPIVIYEGRYIKSSILTLDDTVSFVLVQKNGSIEIIDKAGKKIHQKKCLKNTRSMRIHALSNNEFLTSNIEGTIHLWNISLDCIKTFSVSHTISNQITALFCQEDLLLASDGVKLKGWNIHSNKVILYKKLPGIKFIDYNEGHLSVIANNILEIYEVRN